MTRSLGAVRATPFGRADRVFVLVFLLGLAALYLGFAWTYYGRAEGLFDHTGNLIGRDFVVYWTASVMTLAGQVPQIFDHHAFNAMQQQLAGGGLDLHPWLYPPHILFYGLPLGLLPYLWSYALWSGATLAFYLWAAAGGRWRGWALPALILAPATAANFLGGQNGFLSAALLIGGMGLLDRRPVLAGVLIGLLCFKPHMGLLIPVALVAARLWRPFLSAAMTVAAVVALSLAVFGLESWQLYFEISAPAQTTILTKGTGLFMNMAPTPFIAARILELDTGLRYGLQALFTLGAILGVYAAFRAKAQREAQVAVLLAGVFLATPYALSYDMTIVSVAVLWAFRHAAGTGFLPGEKLLLALVWVLPILVVGANANGLPVAPAILTAFFLLLLARARGRLPAANAAETAP